MDRTLNDRIRNELVNSYFILEKSVGIPEFWLQVLKNSDVVSELIKVNF
jgi:hypothetical protein